MKKFTMPSLKDAVKKSAASLKSSTVRIGGYSIFAALIVIAIAVAVNYFAAALPASATQIDMTANRLYSVSDQTEQVVGALTKDVTVYWVVRSDYEDTTLEKMLNLYDGLSDHLTVVKKDPDVNPTFVKQYTDTTEDNSLVVVCGDRNTYVANSDIYEYDYSNYYTTGTYDVSFAGESALTSAVSYVASDDLPTAYLLEGHGESALSSTFSTAVKKENITTEQLSLLSLEKVPEDADCVIINAPTSDISSDEKDRLLSYLQTGGTLFLITSPPKDADMSNLYSLLAEYGASAADGIVIEGDSNNYAWGAPHYLLPNMESHAITTPLISGNYYVLLPIAQGLIVSDDAARRPDRDKAPDDVRLRVLQARGLFDGELRQRGRRYRRAVLAGPGDFRNPGRRHADPDRLDLLVSACGRRHQHAGFRRQPEPVHQRAGLDVREGQQHFHPQ